MPGSHTFIPPDLYSYIGTFLGSCCKAKMRRMVKRIDDGIAMVSKIHKADVTLQPRFSKAALEARGKYVKKGRLSSEGLTSSEDLGSATAELEPEPAGPSVVVPIESPPTMPEHERPIIDGGLACDSAVIVGSPR